MQNQRERERERGGGERDPCVKCIIKTKDWKRLMWRKQDHWSELVNVIVLVLILFFTAGYDIQGKHISMNKINKLSINYWLISSKAEFCR